MNADEVFRDGHRALVAAAESLPTAAWGATASPGGWTAKELLAHVVAYELLTGDAFASLLDGEATPTLDRLLADGEGFNSAEVEARRDRSAATLLDEYRAAHDRAADLLARVPDGRRRQPGLLPWYGAPYDLEDVVAYMAYGHKQEHCAHLGVMRDRLASDPAV